MATPLANLDAVSRFLLATDPRTRLARDGASLTVVLPDDRGLLAIEWAGSIVTVRLPIAQVPARRHADALELVCDANAHLGVLGFVIYRATGWVEFRTTLVADHAGTIDADALGGIVVTVQESVGLLAEQLAELAIASEPEIPSWWVES